SYPGPSFLEVIWNMIEELFSGGTVDTKTFNDTALWHDMGVRVLERGLTSIGAGFEVPILTDPAVRQQWHDAIMTKIQQRLSLTFFADTRTSNFADAFLDGLSGRWSSSMFAWRRFVSSNPAAIGSAPAWVRHDRHAVMSAIREDPEVLRLLPEWQGDMRVAL